MLRAGFRALSPIESLKPIYLDFNASTPVAPEVVEAMRPYLAGDFGNPSSLHWAARGARQAIATARVHVAKLLGCGPDEVVFTSGGSEANDLALKGLFFQRAGRPSHLITSQIDTRRRSSRPAF